MCGRTACQLSPENLRKACTYSVKESQKYVQPHYICFDEESHYFKPSANISPNEVLPTIVCGKQFCNFPQSRIITPMIWGMIPTWHKGDYKQHGLSTFNCRSETVLQSTLYFPALEKGNRCIVLSNGFYEWTKNKINPKRKIPHYIYLPQPNGIDISNSKTWIFDWNENDGWKGLNLLFMAGMYNTWTSPKGALLYSCSIFTTTPTDNIAWIHDRMPVVLESQAAVDKWLDVYGTSYKEALAWLQPSKELQSHEVSSLVNNSWFKEEKCTMPVNPKFVCE